MATSLYTNNGSAGNGMTWENRHDHPFSELVIPGRQIMGTLVVDVDGTITVEGNKYKIDRRAIHQLGRFIVGGGRIIFCTGARMGRIERTVLTPLWHECEELSGQSADTFFPRVFVMPENAGAILVFKRTIIVENEPFFTWHCLHRLDVPQKAELRELLEKEFKPRYPGSMVSGDHPRDFAPRDYILSLRGLKEGSPRDVIEEIKKRQGEFTHIDWSKIAMKAARTTIDFVHADSGKTISVSWLMREWDQFNGPVIGVGDLGDEFAAVVPTINVNKHKPNEFRMRRMPAMELQSPWEILRKGEYVVCGQGKNEVVRGRSSGKEIHVLRDESGRIIFAKRQWHPPRTSMLNSSIPMKGARRYEVLIPCDPPEGRPVQIKPLMQLGDAGVHKEVEDAGGGTAWIIERLIDIGYFAPQA